MQPNHQPHRHHHNTITTATATATADTTATAIVSVAANAIISATATVMLTAPQHVATRAYKRRGRTCRRDGRAHVVARRADRPLPAAAPLGRAACYSSHGEHIEMMIGKTSSRKRRLIHRIGASARSRR